jgi:hypothetical protein
MAKFIKIGPENPDDHDVEAAKKKKKNHGGLDDWFKKEKWVRVDAPKKKGKFQPCGRGDTSKGKKPVCVPVNKAKNLTEKERKNRVRQKRQKEKEPNPDKKPNNTTYSPGAGGKSNVSETQNIRFVGSMIPLSDLRPKQPKFIKISGVDNEGGIGSDNFDNPLEEMGYNKRNPGEEYPPEELEEYKPYFINLYFQMYKNMIQQILNPMYEDSKYTSIHDFRPALNRKEPEAVKLFMDANRYLAGTSKSRGGSIVGQIIVYKMAAQAEVFLNNDIDIFNFQDKQGPDITKAWHLASTGAFADENIEEEND